MTEFVEECRREWRRLRVPDAIANEMAADLAADLREAADEGVSPEEVLGSGVFDPRAFAASWAAERGVIGLAPVSSGLGRRPGRSLRQMPASVVVVAALGGAVAVIVLVLALVSVSSVSHAQLSSAPAAAAVPAVHVPDVVGFELGAAEGVALAAGLVPEVSSRPGASGRGVVVDQVPEPGSFVERGSTLSLAVTP